MHKYIFSFTVCIAASLLFGIHGMEKTIDDDWEIVPYDSPASNNSMQAPQEDFEIKAKAVGNAILSILGGVVEDKLQHTAAQFEAGIALGSHCIGRLYGQGVAFRNAYENEKNSLLEQKNKDNPQ